MSNPTFRRWTADEIAKLKNLAQRHPRAEIAAKLGRSVAATTVKAHQLKLSLRMRNQSERVQC
jgi:bifunctional pyridoxal-dependent enzyme with beta-cystathionase and maltose regulon repressor activities